MHRIYSYLEKNDLYWKLCFRDMKKLYHSFLSVSTVFRIWDNDFDPIKTFQVTDNQKDVYAWRRLCGVKKFNFPKVFRG